MAKPGRIAVARPPRAPQITRQPASMSRAEPAAPMGTPEETLTYLQRMAGNQAVNQFLGNPTPPPVQRCGATPCACPSEERRAHAQSEEAIPAVQRYQAGESGHGGIEHRALPQAGFTADESNRVYFGNWLRDFSQLAGSGTARDLIDILAWGEFGHGVQEGDLGTYVPSEHLDNPGGGGTIEDPRISAADRARKYQELSPEQRAEFDAENQVDFKARGEQSHVPDYIERGKFHARAQLDLAARLGRTDAGMQAMGNGLHAVEDYFSHSNFVEVAAWDLQHAGIPLGPLEDAIRGTTLGERAATVGGMEMINGVQQPRILTGTYGGHANSIVSLFETIKTEVEHGQLTKAFIIGWLRKSGKTGEEIGQRLGHALGGAAGTVVGGVGGAVGGTVSGAAHGAEEGWAHHSGLSAAWHAVTGFFGGAAEGLVEGAEHGAAEGRREGSQIGGEALGAVGGVVGTGVGAATEALAGVAVADLLAAFPEVLGVMAAVIAAAESDIVAKVGTAVSHVEASHDHLSGPTHSEIAKDAPDNPLFAVSSRLAEVADQAIGCAMIAAWNANAAARAPQPDAIARMTALVDTYVQHPAMDPWWQPYLLGATHGALPPIPSGCDVRDEHHDDQHPTPPQLQDGTREWKAVIEPFATGKAQLPDSGQAVLQGLRRQAAGWRERALTHDATALRSAGIDPEQNFGLHIEIQGWASKSWHSAHNEAERQRRNQELAQARARSVADAAGVLFAGIATVDQIEGMGSGVMIPGGAAIETEGQATLIQGDLAARRASLRAQLAQARAGGAQAVQIAQLQDELEQTNQQIAYFHEANDARANVEETRRAEVRITWHGKTLAGDQ